MRTNGWTRRHLLQSTAVAVAASPLAVFAESLLAGRPAPAESVLPTGSFVYATLASPSPSRSSALLVLQKQQADWRQVQQLEAESPRAAVFDASKQFLYVAHAAARKQGLPSGRVGVYRVDRATGHLHPHAQQRLALSAKRPLALGLAPTGDLLVVAAEGGVFSVLPVLPQGQLQPVSAAYKHLQFASIDPEAVSLQFSPENTLAVQAGGAMHAFRCAADGLTPVESVTLESNIPAAVGPVGVPELPDLRRLAILS